MLLRAAYQRPRKPFFFAAFGFALRLAVRLAVFLAARLAFLAGDLRDLVAILFLLMGSGYR